VRRGGIGPGVGNRLEGGAGFADRVKDVEQVAGAPGEPVEPGDHQHVAWLQPLEQFGQHRSVGLRAAGGLPIDPSGPGLGQLRILDGQGLAGSADAGVSINRHFQTLLLSMTYRHYKAAIYAVKKIAQKFTFLQSGVRPEWPRSGRLNEVR
jgi:hypothetical protein